jgi:hypothetical protein
LHPFVCSPRAGIQLAQARRAAAEMSSARGIRLSTSSPRQSGVAMLRSFSVCALALLSLDVADAATLGRRDFLNGKGA